MDVKIFRGDDDLSDAFQVRDIVFTKEQGFTIPDVDEFDKKAVHIVLYNEGHPIATGRFYFEEDGVTSHCGRICVLNNMRGKDLGRKLMQELERLSVQDGAMRLRLGAQLQAVPFYERCGFVTAGKRFFEEFCEHIWMEKDLLKQE